MIAHQVPPERIVALNDAPVRGDRDHVLYWMIAARRTTHSFGLQRAVELAEQLGKPLVVFEPLRVDAPWSSPRFHRFVVDGMRDNARACARVGVRYVPFVERHPGQGKGLLAALADRACAVVTDAFPTHFLPRMVGSVSLPVRLEQVDGLGLLPLSAHGRVFTTAASFRRHLQKTVGPHLLQFPQPQPLSRRVAGAALPDLGWPIGIPDTLDGLPLDPGVAEVALRGGPVAAASRAHGFLDERLAAYGDRNHPDAAAASGLSPYLHFGHIGAHALLAPLLAEHLERWVPPRATGSRAGWWGLGAPQEAWIDQLVTWRELGAGFCHHFRDASLYSLAALPDWAQRTLADHAHDPRDLVPFDQLEAACSPDPLWNAAQRELRETGVMHNYLRMLWGKRVLEWSESPAQALARLVHLNDRWALDGRDPNSVSGILWTFGRFDRAWGPERPIFGKVRYMTSASTRRKLRLRAYLTRWGVPA
jgi:deoxyribodipyrimidine photo-lyase